MLINVTLPVKDLLIFVFKAEFLLLSSSGPIARPFSALIFHITMRKQQVKDGGVESIIFAVWRISAKLISADN